MDALIAATALEFDLTLATHERDFERVPSLKCEFWAQQRLRTFCLRYCGNCGAELSRVAGTIGHDVV